MSGEKDTIEITRIIFEDVKEFAKFWMQKDIKKLIDLNPNKTYTAGDVLVATSEAFKTHFERERIKKLIDLDPNKTYTAGDVLVATAKAFKAYLEREKLHQQLFDPSLTITVEEKRNQYSLRH